MWGFLCARHRLSKCKNKVAPLNSDAVDIGIKGENGHGTIRAIALNHAPLEPYHLSVDCCGNIRGAIPGASPA